MKNKSNQGPLAYQKSNKTESVEDKPPSDSEDENSESDDDTTDTEDSSEYSDLLEEEEDSAEESVNDFQEEDSDSAGNQQSDDTSDESSISEDDEIKEESSKNLSESPVSHAKSTDSSDVSVRMVTDEYEEDTSDEEDIRNTVGNIPIEWYREYPHIGYDVEGNKLIKPEQGDELDNFLRKADDPNYWRSVTNKMTGQNVILTDDDVKLIQRLQTKKAPAGENLYEPWIDFFTHEKMIHPVSSRPEHKRSFVPSKWEKLKVGQMVHAIKMGWMKPTATKDKDEDDEFGEEPKFYMIWKDDEEKDITKRYSSHIPAPKLPLPGHAESYNPPPEYLFNKEEKVKWRAQDPEDRRINFIPRTFQNLRTVPAYRRFIKERFERCLDLYLCPRQRKMKMNVDPQDLIPKLPKPKDLQPFPTTLAIIYKGHTDIIRSISVCPSGQWIVSGSDDETVRFWEVSTGRCMRTVQLGGKVTCIEWNPNPSISLVAATVERDVVIINGGLGDKLICSNTDEMLHSYTSDEDQTQKGKRLNIDWEVCTGANYAAGMRIKIHHPKDVSHVSWHVKGDYFATVQPKGQSTSVAIHQLSKRRSQNPFSKSKGLVQCVLFHPVRPFLFVATQRYVRVYNLLKQELTKKLMTNCKWVSSMAVHRGGDNVIIGSYDSRLSWFDLDLSTKPYRTLRHHKRALRQVCYHKKYPLFASASDDGTVIICHGMVYSDLMQNPMIVPVKVLRGHTITKSLGVLDCVFHPTQPWIFSSGADETIRLFT